jgi:hypothetical protein
MDGDSIARAAALAAVPLIALGLYVLREPRPPAPAAPAASTAPPEPKGLGPLAGALAERGEAALAKPRVAPSGTPAMEPPRDSVAATNLPLASSPRATAKPIRPPAPKGSCSGVEVRLITESADPAWAFASLSPAPGERAVIRHVGERIGDFRVSKIEWDRVWLTGNGGRCAASMHLGAREANEDVTGARGRRRLPPDERRAAAPWRLSGELSNGIEKLTETSFAVDKGLVPAIFDQAGALLAGVRIEPVRDQDAVVGFELGEVRADSLLERLGVETGDRVLAIDATPARDLASIVKALAAARERDLLVASLERGGERFELRVTAR